MEMRVSRIGHGKAGAISEATRYIPSLWLNNAAASAQLSRSSRRNPARFAVNSSPSRERFFGFSTEIEIFGFPKEYNFKLLIAQSGNSPRNNGDAEATRSFSPPKSSPRRLRPSVAPQGKLRLRLDKHLFVLGGRIHRRFLACQRRHSR